MELSRQMLLLTAVNYGSYYLHITILLFILLFILFSYSQVASVTTPSLQGGRGEGLFSTPYTSPLSEKHNV